MRIQSVSISHFRAFDKKVRIPLSNFTVLTGPNNLGKSTVLRGLNLFFGALERSPHPRLGTRDYYDIDDDYPKRLQGRPGRRWPTQLSIVLDFTGEDLTSAKDKLGLDLPSSFDLTFEFKLNKFGRAWPTPKCSVIKDTQIHDFLGWFSSNFRYVYIPATRNIDELRRSVFFELVEGAIRSVGQSRRRMDVLKKFYDDVRVSIKKVEETLIQELHPYLPDIKSIAFDIGDLDLSEFISVKDVEIDDGAQTTLRHKGDGFKSLFVISILQYIAKQRYGTNLIFGIEEPESHLHPEAVYKLKSTLRSLSSTFQILITTHSPVLIQRDELQSNIIVESIPGAGFSSSAKPAYTLAQIQRSLGIRPQDNMSTAEVIVIVEGPTEEVVLPHLISRAVPELKEVFNSGRVRIMSAHGAPNAPSVIRALARDVTSCIVLLDSDEEGRKAIGKIRDSGLINPIDLFEVPSRDGCLETEFEDLFDSDLYMMDVSLACGISAAAEDFGNARKRSGDSNTKMKKWSDVMECLFNECGKDWSLVSNLAKEAFAKSVVKSIANIDLSSFQWIKSIGGQIRRYLAEQ